MAFSAQSELPPSHQLLLEHLERAFSMEKENSPPRQEQPRRGSPREICCALPAVSPLPNDREKRKEK